MKMSDENAPSVESPKQPWSPPTVKNVGTVGEVLQGGGGKLSPTQEDSGDNRKPKGQG